MLLERNRMFSKRVLPMLLAVLGLAALVTIGSLIALKLSLHQAEQTTVETLREPQAKHP